MVGLGTTISRLSKLQATQTAKRKESASNRLSDLLGFGKNPGALLAFKYVPENLPTGAPLVVVLHGCTQTGEQYDRGSGWSTLAEEHGFALLFPQQQRSNNPNLCFNWFSPADVRRDAGEAMSIRQMIAAMVARFELDQKRIFVTGLSAGGAMTSVMLATYPEVFAGGAIIAGLPFGGAKSMSDAFSHMRGNGYPPDDRLADLVRNATDHNGPWPRVSVWQGSADTTVDPNNAQRIIAQWQGVHGIVGAFPDEESIAVSKRRIWRGKDGRILVEAVIVQGMGHGTPLKTQGQSSCGVSGPYMIEVGISSTWHIAQSWGLIRESTRSIIDRIGSDTVNEKSKVVPPIAMRASAANDTSLATEIGTIIENALRSAGLMR